MLRIVLTILSLIAFLLLSGCSVLGVASKGELEAAMSRQAANQQVMDARLADLGEDLARFEDRLDPRLARVDSTLARTSSELALVQARWQEVREQLIADVDSLRASQARVVEEVDWMRADLDLARTDLTTTRASATQAQVRSRQALQVHFDTLVRQRDQLEAQLLELDTWLAELAAIGADSTTTVELESNAPVPEASAGGQGKVEIREVTAASAR